MGFFTKVILGLGLLIHFSNCVLNNSLADLNVNVEGQIMMLNCCRAGNEASENKSSDKRQFSQLKVWAGLSVNERSR